ncbi:MAG: dihydroorotate dehydrogenase [Nocardioidaceae bacterium]
MPDPTVDLTTRLADATLANPVLTAAGCAGVGRELAPFFDLAELGALVTRSIQRDARSGLATPRVAETASGLLSAVGQQGPGIDGFLATDLPWLAQRKIHTVVSIAGATLEEYAELARRIGNSPGVTGLEVNPLEVAADPYQLGKVVRVVRRETARGVAVLVKLTSEVASMVDVAAAAAEAGADALVLVGGPRGLSIDPATMRPRLGGVVGGLSGPAIKPIALRCVWQVHAAMPGIPLVGVGGVRSGADALEFLLAGATAVQVGSAILHDPSAPLRVRDELGDLLAARGFDRAADAVGYAHRKPDEELHEEMVTR